MERGLFDRIDSAEDTSRADSDRDASPVSERAEASAPRRRAGASADVAKKVGKKARAKSGRGRAEPAARSSRAAPKEGAPGAARRAARRPAAWQLAHWHVAAAAAVVLFVAFATMWRMEPAAAPTAARSAEASASSRTGDLSRLRVGDVVEATDGAIVYEAPGVVRWTLAAGGRLSIEQDIDGPSHVLALERGSLRAEVNPAASRIHRTGHDVVERFAVEVDGTRVAVRGTVFTVTRTTAGMVVNVERGTVAVGQIGPSGLTEGRLLVAPARQSFDADGTLASRSPVDVDRAPRTLLDGALAEGDSDSVQPSGGPAGLAPTGGVASSPATVDRADVSPVSGADARPAGESESVRLLTSEAIRTGLLSCFDRTYQASASGVGFSVSSTFQVTVDETGAVAAARFVPPVRAELARCAGSVIAGKFASGPDRLSVPIQYRVDTAPTR